MKVFQEGLKYVFSYKKYKQSGFKSDYSKKLNGREVTRVNMIEGIIPERDSIPWSISINWCKCIRKKEK